MKKIHHHVSKLNKPTKYVIAIVLLLVVVLLAISMIRNVSKPVDIYAITQAYIMNDSYYTNYSASNLNLVSTENGTCNTCFIVTYTFDVHTDKLVESVKGFKAVVSIEKANVTNVRYIGVMR